MSLVPIALLAIVLVGALVVVAIAVGVASAAPWVAFGISLATAVAGIGLALVARRGPLVWIGAGIAGLAGWTVIATTGIFSTGTARWIAFGSGLGYFFAALGAIGIHGASPARVVHVLEVRGDPARS